MTTKTTWEKANFKWEDNSYLWNLVEIVDKSVETIATQSAVKSFKKERRYWKDEHNRKHYYWRNKAKE
tara:strand:+ start:143 stop:346 length:204 start_codon:yes stop_codon:yes gene_type:complete